MRNIITTHRPVFLALLAVGLIMYVGLSALYRSGIPQSKIQAIVQRDLTRVFGREVTIGSVSGNLITTIVLNDVQIASYDEIDDGLLLDIGKMIAKINPISILRYGGKVIPAIRILRVESSNMYAGRIKGKGWNIIDFLSQFKAQGEQPKGPVFAGRIIFDGMQGVFVDEVGWRNEPGDTPMVAYLDDVSCFLDFRERTRSVIAIKGTFQHNQSSVSLNGYVDARYGTYELALKVPKMDAKTWGRYILPVDDFAIHDDALSVTGTISKVRDEPSKKMTFLYDLDVVFQSLRLQVPFMTPDLTQMGGTMKFHNGDGDDQKLEFDQFSAIVADIPVRGNGQIDIRNKSIGLNFDTSTFDLLLLKSIFPSLEIWDYAGSGRTKFGVDGDLEAPKIQGAFYGDTLDMYGLTPQRIRMSYGLKKKRFSFSITEGVLFDGQLGGNGYIGFDKDDPDFNATLFVDEMGDITAIPDAVDIQSNRSRAKLLVGGTWEKFDVTASLGGDVSIYKQRTKALSTHMTVQNQKAIHINELQWEFEHGGAIVATGNIDGFSTLAIQFSGQDIKLSDPIGTQSSSHTGVARLSGHATIVLDRDNIDDVVKHSSGMLELFIQDPILADKQWDFIQFKGDFDKGITHIENLLIRADDQNLQLSGVFKNESPDTIDLKLRDWDVRPNSWLQRYIPSTVQPFFGTLSTDITITPIQSRRPGYINTHRGQAKGQGVDAMVRGQLLDEVEWDLSWDGSKLVVSNLMLSQDESIINVEGNYQPGGAYYVLLKRGTTVSLTDFSTVIGQYVTASGSVIAHGYISGDGAQRKGKFSLDATELQINDFHFDKVRGEWGITDTQIEFKSVTLLIGDNHYVANGVVDWGEFWSESSPSVTPKYNIELDIRNSDLETTLTLGRNLVQTVRKARQSQQRLEGDNATDSWYVSEQINSVVRKNTQVLYSAYSTQNNIAKFQKSVQKFQEKNPQGDYDLGAISGTLKGRIIAYSRDRRMPYVNVNATAENVLISDSAFQEMTLSVVTRKENMAIHAAISDAVIAGSEVKSATVKGRYHPSGMMRLDRLDIKTPTADAKSILYGSIPLASFWTPDIPQNNVDLTAVLDKNDIDVLSLVNKKISQITHDGYISASITGPLNNLTISNQDSVLKTMTFFPASSRFLKKDRPVVINAQQVQWQRNKFHLDPIELKWRANAKSKRSVVRVTGDVTMLPVNIVDGVFAMDMNLVVTDTDITLNMPSYVGDVALQNVSVVGKYHHPLSKNSRRRHQKLVGTPQELGPLVRGDLTLSNGKIIAGRGDSNFGPSFMLNVNGWVGRGVRVEGGVLGKGVLGVANKLQLDLEPTPKDARILITGSTNLPRTKDSVVIKRGTVSFFDRVFEILPEHRQAQFLQDNPEKISKNKFSLITDYPANASVQQAIPSLTLRAVSFVDVTQSQDVDLGQQLDGSSISTQKSYEAIVVLIDGRVDELEAHMDIGHFTVGRPVVQAGNPQLIQFYTTPFLDQQADTAQTNDAVRLITPQFLSDSGDTGFGAVGEHQANLYFRNTVSPIERRLAERVGLYDLRIDYNVGRNIRNRLDSTGDDLAEDDLLGVNFTWSLAPERLFLRLKTDVNVSSDSDHSDNDLRLTESELTYLFSRNFTMNFSNITRYRESSEFRPVLSLKLHHAF